MTDQLLASGSIDGSIAVSLRGTPVINLDHGMGPINSVNFSTSYRLIAAGDEQGTIHVWELKNRELLKSFKVSIQNNDTKDCFHIKR
jgi:WD40 repeat protein